MIFFCFFCSGRRPDFGAGVCCFLGGLLYIFPLLSLFWDYYYYFGRRLGKSSNVNLRVFVCCPCSISRYRLFRLDGFRGVGLGWAEWEWYLLGGCKTRIIYHQQ